MNCGNKYIWNMHRLAAPHFIGPPMNFRIQVWNAGDAVVLKFGVKEFSSLGPFYTGTEVWIGMAATLYGATFNIGVGTFLHARLGCLFTPKLPILISMGCIVVRFKRDTRKHPGHSTLTVNYTPLFEDIAENLHFAPDVHKVSLPFDSVLPNIFY